jgi:MFS family permease
VPLAFLIDALSFLAVLFGLWLMDERELRPPPLLPRPKSVRDVRDTLAEGLGYVRHTPVVLLAVTVVGLVSTFGMNFTVLVPPLAQDVLHSGASGYGFLMTASGIGSLAAALLIAFQTRVRTVALVGGAVVLGVAEVVSGWSRLFPLTLVAMAFVGIGGITMAATANTLIQLNVPDALRGRVMSVYTTVFAGSTPIGGLVMGAIASRLGVDIALIVGGIISGVVGVGGALYIRRARARRAAGPPGGHPASAPGTVGGVVGAGRRSG